VLLDAPEILALNQEIDAIRAGILERYRRIDCPITMIMSTAMAGANAEGRAAELNRNWQAGLDRLIRAQPHVKIFRLDAGHQLVVTHASQVAEIIRSTSIEETGAVLTTSELAKYAGVTVRGWTGWTELERAPWPAS
jgi:hypothetical protein